MSSGQKWWADQEEEYYELCEEFGEKTRHSGGCIDLKHLEDLREKASGRPPLAPPAERLYQCFRARKDQVRRVYQSLFGEPLTWTLVRDDPSGFLAVLRDRAEVAIVNARTKAEVSRVHLRRYQAGPDHEPNFTREESLTHWRGLYAKEIRAERKAEGELTAAIALAEEIDKMVEGVEIRPAPMGIG